MKLIINFISKISRKWVVEVQQKPWKISSFLHGTDMNVSSLLELAITVESIDVFII